MKKTPEDVLFSSELWERALAKYAAATHVTVQLFDTDLRMVFGPIHPTPLFEIFDRAIFRKFLSKIACQRPSHIESKHLGVVKVDEPDRRCELFHLQLPLSETRLPIVDYFGGIVKESNAPIAICLFNRI